MLPFMKRKQEASTSAPVENLERKPDEGADEFDSMESAMEELAGALERKDFKAAAECFRSAIELMDSEPHDEGEHLNKEQQ